MDQLLQEITMLPGVLGCYVYNAEHQIAGSKMPPIFRENNLQTIGNLLSRTMQMGQMAQMNFKGIEIKFNESLLIIKPIANGVLLIIICEPTANKSLVSMTTGMLADDIAKTLKNPIASHPTASQSVQGIMPQHKQVQQAQAQKPKEAEIDEKLAPILEQVKDALAMAIGPIAGPIMKDTIEIWAQQGNPSFSNLSSLAKLLCEEINDDTLEMEFMTTIKSIKN